MKPNHILLVEDNVSDVELLRRTFTKYRVVNDIVVTQDGEEALDYLFAAASGSNSPLPALIMLNLNLPIVSGLEVLRRIREDVRTSQTAVVILTTFNSEPGIESARALGANAYLRKPVDFHQLAHAIVELDFSLLVLNEPLS